jgi:hypothetical protein
MYLPAEFLAELEAESAGLTSSALAREALTAWAKRQAKKAAK